MVAAAFNKSGELLAALDKRARVVVFHLKSNRYAVVRKGGPQGIALAFSTNRRTELFVSLVDGTIECVDTGAPAAAAARRAGPHGSPPC